MFLYYKCSSFTLIQGGENNDGSPLCQCFQSIYSSLFSFSVSVSVSFTFYPFPSHNTGYLFDTSKGSRNRNMCGLMRTKGSFSHKELDLINMRSNSKKNMNAVHCSGSSIAYECHGYKVL